MGALAVLQAIVGGAFAVAGLVLMAASVLALLRFPDFYTRLHALPLGDAAGGVLLLVGLGVASGDGGMMVRLMILAALLVAGAPTAAQLVANAAHAGGLTPVAGAAQTRATST